MIWNRKMLNFLLLTIQLKLCKFYFLWGPAKCLDAIYIEQLGIKCYNFLSKGHTKFSYIFPMSESMLMSYIMLGNEYYRYTLCLFSDNEKPLHATKQTDIALWFSWTLCPILFPEQTYFSAPLFMVDSLTTALLRVYYPPCNYGNRISMIIHEKQVVACLDVGLNSVLCATYRLAPEVEPYFLEKYEHCKLGQVVWMLTWPRAR